MHYPSFREEKKLWEKGYKLIAGIDEVGVGPLAGPVVVCALICKKGFKIFGSGLEKIRDSKLLSQKHREQYASIIRKNKHIVFAVASVLHTVVDKINIYNATHLAMEKAILKLKQKPDFVLIDGRMKISNPAIAQRAIVKGDRKIFSIAAASVIAKVARDAYMKKMAKKYPNYGFERHKGYGTKAHYKAISVYGPTPIHRKTFLGEYKEILR